MKYIDLYLSKRKEELEKEEEKIIEEFKEKYKKCETDSDYQELINDCACSYDYELTWIELRISEVELLRKDLILDKVGSD